MLAVAAAFAAAAAAACARADAGPATKDGGKLARDASTSSSAAERPPFETAVAPADPCAWVPAAEVEAIVGPLAGAPVRVRPGQRPRPDPAGEGCMYTLAERPRTGLGTVTLSVLLQGATIADLQTLTTHALMGAPSAPAADSAAGEIRARGWDHESRIGLGYLARVGHVGVRLDLGTIELPGDRIRRLAARVRDQVADRPFADPGDPELAAVMAEAGDSPEPLPSTPDPCALLTRAEAEAVLGKLAVPPYRSTGSSPLWQAGGDGCSYFTGNHRVLSIKPTLANGRSLFRLAVATGRVAANATGVETAASDTLDGPWDDVMQGADGTLRVLKGDRMLEVVWQTSAVDQAGAVRLAAYAAQRL